MRPNSDAFYAAIESIAGNFTWLPGEAGLHCTSREKLKGQRENLGEIVKFNQRQGSGQQ